MNYAKIVNGAVVAYPYTFRQLRLDHPQTSFPATPTDATFAEYGVLPVADTAKPPYDQTKNIVEGIPVLVNGVWTQTWDQSAASAAEIAARQLDVDDASDFTVVKADSFIPQFLAMRPAQLDTYIETNVTNLATTRDLLKKMAMMLLILSRRVLR